MSYEDFLFQLGRATGWLMIPENLGRLTDSLAEGKLDAGLVRILRDQLDAALCEEDEPQEGGVL